MNCTLDCDWPLEQTRWSNLACSGLLLSRKHESVGHEVIKKPQSVMGYLKIPPLLSPARKISLKAI